MKMTCCPSCGINLSSREAAGSTCPICGESLTQPHNSAPQDIGPADNEPVGTTRSYYGDSSAGDSRSNDLPQIDASASPMSQRRRSFARSGWGSKWWIIVLAIVGIRACNSLMRSSQSTSQPYYQENNFGESYERRQEKLNRIIEQARRRQWQEEYDNDTTVVDE